MDFTGISVEELAAAISVCPPASLMALRLLREREPAPNSVFPADVTRDEVVKATMELTRYMRDVSALAKQVRGIRGVPTASEDAEAFSL